jgi:DNA-directed RNA polymerase specialized sigma24 family protein
VILLRIVAGLDVARVSKIVGKRPGTVRMLQLRGLRRLQELMDEIDRVDEGVTR